MRRVLSTITAAVIAATLTPVAVRAQAVKVIVNPSNGISELAAADVASLFLKRVQKFPGGGAAVPVDQAKNSPVRATFARTLLGRPAAAVEAYWQQQIFAGGDLPPAIKPTDDEVIDFVKATPNAIGYVSAGAAVSGVKVVAVK